MGRLTRFFTKRTLAKLLLAFAGWLAGVLTQMYGPELLGKYTSWKHDIPRLEIEARALRAKGWQAFTEGKTAEGHNLYALAYAIYRQAADHGSNEALIQLGIMNCVGWGVKTNGPLGRDYLSRASLNIATLEQFHAVPKLSSCR